ncbi:hypothetical protein Esti_003498 [Eimeria stiedai]
MRSMRCEEALRTLHSSCTHALTVSGPPCAWSRSTSSSNSSTSNSSSSSTSSSSTSTSNSNSKSNSNSNSSTSNSNSDSRSASNSSNSTSDTITGTTITSNGSSRSSRAAAAGAAAGGGMSKSLSSEAPTAVWEASKSAHRSFEEGLLAAPVGPLDPANSVQLSQSITAWHILTYPLQTLQSRLLCARYLSVISVPVFPEYQGSPSSPPAATAAAAPAALNTEIRSGVRLIPQRPLLLASCRFASLNVFALVGHAMRVVYDAEGVPGLFRGLVPSCLHRMCRDCIHWALLRYCYRSTVLLTRRLTRALGWVLIPLKLPSRESVLDEAQLNFNEDGELQAIGSLREVSDSEDNTQSSPSQQQQQQQGKVALVERVATELLPPILLKASPSFLLPPAFAGFGLGAELLSYPLLVLATRLSVIESRVYPLPSALHLPKALSLSRVFSFCVDVVTSQLVVGFWEMAYLTLHADGLFSFWGGVLPFLLSRFVDETVSFFFLFTSSSSRSRKAEDGEQRLQRKQTDEAAAAATTATPAAATPAAAAAAETQQQQQDKPADNPVEHKLRQLEEHTMRAWLSAILGTAAAPLAQLSVVQRCQSRVEYRPWLSILRAMPWKPLMLQFGICCVFLAMSGAVLATTQQRLAEIEAEEDGEGFL